MINFCEIGFIKTSYINNAPIQPQPSSDDHYLEIKDEYIPGLKYLDKFNYIYVIYYLDRVDRNDEIKMQLTKEDNEVGLFASRTPFRPNPIALSIVKIIRIKGNKIYISGIDALDNSPILDIKPYIKELDLKNDANSGWLKEDNMLDNKIHLYTDGACSGNPGPGGYAALIINGNKEHEVTGYEPETTNNRMELMAVIEGLKEVKKGSVVKLVSDSNYVLKGLEEWMPDWKKRGWKTASNKPVKNKDLWKELDSVINEYKVEFIKVKGHSGHEFNERVDSMAREEIESNYQG
ncbi:MAG: ribonuclease HI [bacterium]